MIKHWTAEEEQILIDCVNQGLTYSACEEFLDRSLEAIKTRGKRLLAQGRFNKKSTAPLKSWTEEEISILHQEYDFDELEKLLPGKTRRAIQTKCEKLGITKRFPGYSASKGTMYVDKPTTLYLVDFGDYKKVGVCQVSIWERLQQEGEYSILDQLDGLDLETALEYEQIILKKMRPFRVRGVLRRGYSECFNYPCTSLEEIC